MTQTQEITSVDPKKLGLSNGNRDFLSDRLLHVYTIIVTCVFRAR